jgi:hypothetical protein
VRRTISLSGLAVLFVAGVILAGTAAAQDTTTTLTTTEQTTSVETTTEPATTVVTTATVQQTTTRRVIVTPTTTASSSSEGGTPAWVWILLGILGGLLILAVAMLVAGRGRGSKVPPEERRRRLDGAVGTWAVQGWAIESQSGDSAVLRRGGELMLVSVDEAGHVGTRPLQGQ